MDSQQWNKTTRNKPQCEREEKKTNYTIQALKHKHNTPYRVLDTEEVSILHRKVASFVDSSFVPANVLISSRWHFTVSSVKCL